MGHVFGMKRHGLKMRIGFLLLLAGVAAADENRHVLVLCRGGDAASVALARHYAEAREVPGDCLLPLDCPATETVERADFDRSIREPVVAWLNKRGWLAEKESEPVVLVILRGVPLRINGTLGNFGQRTREQHRENDTASVDSELAALALPNPVPVNGSVENPAFGPAGARPRLIVGRLDGPDDATARRLVDDALAVERGGKVRGRALIDHAGMAARQGAEYERGDAWLKTMEARFAEAGFPVTADAEAALITSDEGEAGSVFFYAGWYAPHVSGLLRQEDFHFQTGAVVCHIHSLSAQTVRAKTQRWAGPLLARGAAVVLGNVDEPFLSHATHLDVFFDRLLAGDSAGEAMWKATPRLSWMNVMLGDPLYQPFGKK